MKLKSVKDMLISNTVNVTNGSVSTNFVKANYNYCLDLADDYIKENYNRFLPKVFSWKTNVCYVIIYILSLLLFRWLSFDYVECIFFSGLLLLNLDFLIAKKCKEFFCKFLVINILKVKVKKIKYNPKGYNFVVFSTKGKSVNVTTCYDKVLGDNSKIYFIHESFLYYALFDYVTSCKFSLDLNRFNSGFYGVLAMEVGTFEYLNRC